MDPTFNRAGSVYSGTDNLEVLKEAVNYNAFLKREIVRHGDGARTALDFGAGNGLFPSALRETGVKVICVEPDPDLAGRLKAMGFETHTRIDDVAPASLEYVYSLNVLEHINDDLGALRELYFRLKPGGRLFLYVPAFPVLFSSMDRKVGHVRRYTKAPAVRLVRAAGFEVRHAAYADSLGFVAAMLFKFIGNREGTLNPTAVKIYDTIVFPVSRLCDRLVGGLFGKNLMISAIRPR
ncbi:MAG TPA: class I SAM-dependent methyltransferase [Nitrospiria bacterium]|nr:class I SAM-dependent methyltransferase [Nitrospiria bacterium]